MTEGKNKTRGRGGAETRTGLDLGYSDRRIDNLAQEGAGKCAHSCFSCTVHAAARVRFPTRNRAQIDDMARVAGFEVCLFEFESVSLSHFIYIL
jgi:hypothetical protein